MYMLVLLSAHEEHINSLKTTDMLTDVWLL